MSFRAIDVSRPFWSRCWLSSQACTMAAHAVANSRGFGDATVTKFDTHALNFSKAATSIATILYPWYNSLLELNLKNPLTWVGLYICYKVIKHLENKLIELAHAKIKNKIHKKII